MLTSNESEAEKASVSFCESASEESDDELNELAAEARAVSRAARKAAIDELAAAAAACDINDESVNEARAIAHAARKVTFNDVCVVCGGRGHWSVTAGKKCLTTLLGNKIPKEELEATQYPNGIKYPSLSRIGKYKKYDRSHDSKRVGQGRDGK